MHCNKFLNGFIYNVFDIYPENEPITSKEFIYDKCLDLNKVINHPLLKVNIIFVWTYNKVFGIYPTKKCFASWYTNKFLGDQKVFESILEYFIPIQLGLLPESFIISLVDEYKQFFSSITGEIIKKIIILKWEHRYQTKISNVDENLAIIYKHLKTIEFSNCNKFNNLQFNPVTGFYNRDISFLEHELVFMNILEKIQYILLQDHHWMLNSFNSGCIISNISGDILQNTKEVLEDITKQNVSIYHVKKNSVLCDDEFDGQLFSQKYGIFQYHITQCILKIIPKIYSKCIIINNDAEFSLVSLSKNQIYHLFLGEQSSFDAIKTKYSSFYHISNKLGQSLRMNVLCGGYIPKEMNTISNNIKWHFASKSLEHKNSVKFALNQVPFTQADIIVDFHDELPVESYIINGVVPILINKNPWVVHEITGFYLSKTEFEKFLENFENLETIVVLKKMQKNCRMTRLLLESDTWKYLLKQHLELSSGGQISHKQNSLIYYNFITFYFQKHLLDIISLVPCRHPHYYTITIDSRPSPLTIISGLFTLINLDMNWKLKIFVSKKSAQWYNERLGDLAEIQCIDQLEISHFHIDHYNYLLKSHEFWCMIPTKKCLIIQDDGILLRKGIDSWLDYDYVGAPWLNCPENKYIKDNINEELVGNGGISLRNVAMMKMICEKYHCEKLTLFFHNINQEPEDCYFVDKVLKLGGKIPSNKKASYFSTEQVFNKKSLAVHKFWVYHTPDKIYKFFWEILNE